MEENKEIKQRRNKKTKQKGNGQGTLYYSEALKCWVGQYKDLSRKKTNFKTMEK